MEYPEWQGTPNCRSVDSEEFFVPEGSGTYREVNMLKKICNNCEVKQQCLDYSLKNGVLGYWGGYYSRSKDRFEMERYWQPIHRNSLLVTQQRELVSIRIVQY